jgi:hypothetical protein
MQTMVYSVTVLVFCLLQASLAFAAIKDRKAIGKVMITIDDERSVKSKL